MKYFFAFTYIINSLGFLFYKWWFILFVIGSLIALSAYVPEISKEKCDSITMASIVIGVVGAVVLFFVPLLTASLNFKPCLWWFLSCIAVAFYATDQKTKIKIKERDESTKHLDSYHTLDDYLPSRQPYSRFKITNDNRIYSSTYFAMIAEYQSAYDQGIYDQHIEDWEQYPLYTYKPLPCELAEDYNRFKVFIHVNDRKLYIGYLMKEEQLEYSIEHMKSWYVQVTGGSTYVGVKGKATKTWLPLQFTLVIRDQ